MPFVANNKKQTKSEAGYPLGYIYGKRTKGDVGIEIEIEGCRLPYNGDIPQGWVSHSDGSLRGEENAEYVLSKPVQFGQVGHYIDKLWEAFAAKKSRFDDSNRTSVHVHLNCQSFHMNRIAAFAAIYFTVEEILTEWCGEHRVGNLFCLRAKDAPAIVTNLRDFIKSDGRTTIGDNFHYAGLNFNALMKFGSVEVRTMRGTFDKDTIINWVGILERLYEASAEYKDPRDVCTLFSSRGPNDFFDTLLGDKALLIRRDVTMKDQEFKDSLYEGIRIAQDVCYCRDWSLFEAVDVKDDPFGRMKRRPIVINGHTFSGGDQNPTSVFQQFMDQAHAQAIPHAEYESMPEPDPDYWEEHN